MGGGKERMWMSVGTTPLTHFSWKTHPPKKGAGKEWGVRRIPWPFHETLLSRCVNSKYGEGQGPLRWPDSWTAQGERPRFFACINGSEKKAKHSQNSLILSRNQCFDFSDLNSYCWYPKKI